MEDPRQKTEEYLDKHKIPQLFEAITAQLLYEQPERPKEFICRYLEQVKVAGTPTLLTEEDLATMFGMFDVTNRGVITAEQAANGLKSLLGPGCDPEAAGLRPGRMLQRPDFVAIMYKALTGTVPYRSSSR